MSSNNQAVGMDIKEKLEIYKICVDMADKTSERRLKNNTFIITINTGLISLNSYLSLSQEIQPIWHFILSVSCIIINIYWIFLISTYRKINEAKYQIINNFENEFELRPFTNEYDLLNSKDYYHLSTIERFIPATLIILNAVIILLSLVSKSEPTSPSFTIINIISHVI